MKKRVFSLLLVMALCLTLVPATAASGGVRRRHGGAEAGL